MRLLSLSGILILNIVAIAANHSLRDDSNATYPLSPKRRDRYIQRVSDGTNMFSDKFFQALVKNESNDLLISPFGVALSLSMSAVSAKRKAERTLKKALDLPKYEDDRRRAFQSLVDRFNIHESIEMRVANSLFATPGIYLHPKYIASCKRAFRSSVQYVDFNKSAEASVAINELCAKQTNSRITEIVNADDIRESTSEPQIVVVNTIHFKGAWSKKFNVSSTKGKFRCANGTTTSVTYISGNHTVRFGEYPDVNASFIELSFLSDSHKNNMSAFILLPNEINGLAYLEENLDKISIRSLRKLGQYRAVNIRLPQLKIENEFELDEPLKRMNMSNLIDPRSGEFQPLKNSTRFFIDKYVQKTFMEINGEGSEAAAATRRVFRPADPVFIPPVNLPSEEEVKYVEFLGSGGKVYTFRQSPSYTFETKISEKGSETDAETVADASKFIVDRPGCLIIATTNNTPLKVFIGRLNA